MTLWHDAFAKVSTHVDIIGHDPAPYSSTILKNILSLVLQILTAFECNKTSDWLNHTV